VELKGQGHFGRFGLMLADPLRELRETGSVMPNASVHENVAVGTQKSEIVLVTGSAHAYK
jgi:hypothetical protein